ncbi:MAG: hypothetical protein H7328_04615 [Bdellovibrio sp.]|nr:hypothetical protein [Bdellovibrio sp.]
MRNCLSKKIIYAAHYVAVTFIFASCNYNKGVGDPRATILSEAEVSQMAIENNYASVQKLVISNQCLTCHADSTGNKGGLNLETYSKVKTNLNQMMYRVLETKDMPPAGLTGYSFQLMKLWLESGAPEQNISDGAGQVFTGPLNWSKIKNQILAKNCLDCHQGPNPDANLDLSNLSTVKEKYAIFFDRVFVKQDMPPEPYSALTINEKQALMKWISQGFQQ